MEGYIRRVKPETLTARADDRRDFQKSTKLAYSDKITAKLCRYNEIRTPTHCGVQYSEENQISWCLTVRYAISFVAIFHQKLSSKACTIIPSRNYVDGA